MTVVFVWLSVKLELSLFPQALLLYRVGSRSGTRSEYHITSKYTFSEQKSYTNSPTHCSAFLKTFFEMASCGQRSLPQRKNDSFSGSEIDFVQL